MEDQFTSIEVYEWEEPEQIQLEQEPEQIQLEQFEMEQIPIEQRQEPEQIQIAQDPEQILLEPEPDFISSDLISMQQEPEQIQPEPEQIQIEQEPEPVTDPVNQIQVLEPEQPIFSSTDNGETVAIQKEILSVLKEIKAEKDADSLESETEQETEEVIIEEETETTTGVLDVISAEIRSIKAQQAISVHDQQLIGQVQTAVSSITLGALVVWFFIGRIR